MEFLSYLVFHLHLYFKNFLHDSSVIVLHASLCDLTHSPGSGVQATIDVWASPKYSYPMQFFLLIFRHLFNYLTQSVDILGTSVQISKGSKQNLSFAFSNFNTSVFPSLVNMINIPLVDNIRKLVFILDPSFSFYPSITLSLECVNCTS